MNDLQRRIMEDARNEGDSVTLADLHPSRDFDDPNKCADFIMDQLYDGYTDYGRLGHWVVAILGSTGLFFPYREVACMEEGYSYFRITWNCDGCRVLEGEL